MIDPVLTDEQGQPLRRHSGDGDSVEVLHAEIRELERQLAAAQEHIAAYQSNAVELESMVDELTVEHDAALGRAIEAEQRVVIDVDVLGGWAIMESSSEPSSTATTTSWECQRFVLTREHPHLVLRGKGNREIRIRAWPRITGQAAATAQEG